VSDCWEGDQCDRVRAPSRGVGSILANSRGARKKASLACTRRWGASRRCHRTPATYTHTPPHTRTHAHTGNQRNTRARAYCNCILWFFATDQQHARSKTYPRDRILTYSPRTGTRSKCLQNPWGVILTMEPNLTTTDAFKMQWVFPFLPQQTNKQPLVLHTRV